MLNDTLPHRRSSASEQGSYTSSKQPLAQRPCTGGKHRCGSTHAGDMCCCGVIKRVCNQRACAAALCNSYPCYSASYGTRKH